jgi:hypothetical protein
MKTEFIYPSVEGAINKILKGGDLVVSFYDVVENTHCGRTAFDNACLRLGLKPIMVLYGKTRRHIKVYGKPESIKLIKKQMGGE